MSTITILADRFLCDLAADAPAAAEVQPGAELTIHCRLALDRDVGKGPVRAEQANPGTGPIAVAGAAPGMAIRLDILDIQVESPGFISASFKGDNQAVPVQDGVAVYKGIRIPLCPSLGVLGVAPRAGSWSTMDCGDYGGNIDTTDLAAGASVWLPVFQSGGRFIVGDIHAVMGDGEIGGQGLEVAGTLSVRVSLETQPLTEHLYIVRHGMLMVLGAGETVEAACRDSAVAMMKLLERAGVMDEFSAMKLLGLAGAMRFGQYCCRTKSVRTVLPLAYVPQLGLGENKRN